MLTSLDNGFFWPGGLQMNLHMRINLKIQCQGTRGLWLVLDQRNAAAKLPGSKESWTVPNAILKPFLPQPTLQSMTHDSN
jgi:hypothetical protein